MQGPPRKAGVMPKKPTSKRPGTNPGGSPKLQKEAIAEQSKMRDMARRPDKNKMMKGNRRRAGGKG